MKMWLEMIAIVVMACSLTFFSLLLLNQGMGDEFIPFRYMFF